MLMRGMLGGMANFGKGAMGYAGPRMDAIPDGRKNLSRVVKKPAASSERHADGEEIIFQRLSVDTFGLVFQVSLALTRLTSSTVIAASIRVCTI